MSPNDREHQGVSEGGSFQLPPSFVGNRRVYFKEKDRKICPNPAQLREVNLISDSLLRVCLTWGIESEKAAEREQILPILQVHSVVGYGPRKRWNMDR